MIYHFTYFSFSCLLCLGFWYKVDYNEEYPNVNFRYEMITLLESRDTDPTTGVASPVAGKLIGWSTYPNWNQMMQPYLRVPAVEVCWLLLLVCSSTFF